MSKFIFRIGETDDGTPVEMDLETLIATRIGITANSGGGKSYALRVIIERAGEHVQWIILDLAGEFASLRKKFPNMLLVGAEGELPVSAHTAGKDHQGLFGAAAAGNSSWVPLEHSARGCGDEGTVKTQGRSCEGKFRLTRQEAHDMCRQVRKRCERNRAIRHRNISAYRCVFCGGWHIGHGSTTKLSSYTRLKRIQYSEE